MKEAQRSRRYWPTSVLDIALSDAVASGSSLGWLQDAKITLPQAVQSALAHTAGTAVKAKLDSHWGMPCSQVDALLAAHTVMELALDTRAGSVIRAKKD